MTKKRKILVVAAVIIVILAVWGLIQKANAKKDDVKDAAPKYYVTKVSRPTPFSINGQVESKQVSTLGLPSGKVQEIRVKNGQSVHKGDVILTTYDSEKQESKEEVQQELDKAKRTQQSELSSLNSAKQQLGQASKEDDGYSDLQNQVKEAQSSYDDAVSEVTAAQTKLNSISGKINNVLIAPFDGIVDVDDKKQDAPSITLYSHEKQVSASVSEYDYEKLSQGQKVEVKALATKKTQESTIAFLSQVPVEGKSTGYPLTIDVDGNNFMDGQTVKISVPQEQIRLPKDSVRNNSVYVVDSKGRVHKQKIDGKFADGYFCVEQGVQVGERIVANPDKHLKDGKKVD